MPWLKKGEVLETTVDNLAAKILCKRHNEALSPLDDEAALFFSILRKAFNDLKRNRHSRKPILHLVCGDALELWMLKIACGQYFALGGSQGSRVSETHTIDLAKVRRAFFDRQWDPHGGLYFNEDLYRYVKLNNHISIASLTADSDRRFCGAEIYLHGFGLQCVFDVRGGDPIAWRKGPVSRPTELVLWNRGCEHRIMITWPSGTPENSFVLQALFGKDADEAKRAYQIK
jgi:hypothetical protein